MKRRQKEEMLYVISLPADTQDISLFEAVKDFYERVRDTNEENHTVTLWLDGIEDALPS